MYRVAVSDVCAAAQSAVCTSKVPLKNSVDTYTASAKRKDAARCLQGVGACGRISPTRGDKLRLRTSSIKKATPYRELLFGACGRIRTGDLLITSELLCQLSHTSACASEGKSQAVLYHVLPCPSTINFVLRQGIRRVIMKPQVQKISSGETIPCCGKPV